MFFHFMLKKSHFIAKLCYWTVYLKFVICIKDILIITLKSLKSVVYELTSDLILDLLLDIWTRFLEDPLTEDVLLVEGFVGGVDYSHWVQ